MKSSEGRITVGLDRHSSEKTKADDASWQSFAKDYRTITGLPSDTTTVRVEVERCQSYSFPVLPGTKEFKIWLENDNTAMLSMGIAGYIQRTTWPSTLEVFRSQQAPAKNLILVSFEDSLTSSNRLLAATCGTAHFTFDWACRVGTVSPILHTWDDKSTNEELRRLQRTSSSIFMGWLNEHIWFRFSSYTIAKVFARTEEDSLVDVLVKASDWRQKHKDISSAGRGYNKPLLIGEESRQA